MATAATAHVFFVFGVLNPHAKPRAHAQAHREVLIRTDYRGIAVCVGEAKRKGVHQTSCIGDEGSFSVASMFVLAGWLQPASAACLRMHIANAACICPCKQQCTTLPCKHETQISCNCWLSTERTCRPISWQCEQLICH